MMEKQPPSDLDAERATLGSLLMDRDAIIAVAPWLAPEHFYLEKHRWVYAAALAVYGRREPPDLTTVSTELRARNQLAEIGDVALLVELTNNVPTAYHVEYYARAVEKTARLRKLIQAGARISALGYDEQRDEEELVAEAFDCLTEVMRRRQRRNLVSIRQAVDAAWQALEGGVKPGTPTGLTDLDRMLGGLRGGDLVVLAARPSVGKTSLAGQIVYDLARREQRVLVVSMEMDALSITHRLWSLVTGIDGQRIRTQQLSAPELGAIADACGHLSRLPIDIDEGGTQTIAGVRNTALGLAAAHGALGLIVVDYLQLMTGSRRRDGNRVQEVSEISRGLKELARELTCPVLAISQLNRAVESRTSHVPVLADLRDSGAVEQDADVVIFIYRDELYDKDTDKQGIAELHIAKHRNGPLGVVDVFYDKRCGRWRDLATHQTPQGYA